MDSFSAKAKVWKTCVIPQTFSEGNHHRPILQVSHMSFAPCWINILLNAYVSSFSLLLMHETKCQQCSFFALGFGVSNYWNFEFIWLVAPPFNANFNQHTSSHSITSLSPPNEVMQAKLSSEWITCFRVKSTNSFRFCWARRRSPTADECLLKLSTCQLQCVSVSNVSAPDM
jgi:hypothetical protein